LNARKLFLKSALCKILGQFAFKFNSINAIITDRQEAVVIGDDVIGRAGAENS